MERRVSERYDVWFPLWLASEGFANLLAISQDTSRTGIKLATASALEVGALVTVTFRIPSEDGGFSTETRVRGQVVRVQENAEDERGIWPYWAVIELDEPLRAIEALRETADPLRIH